jgi:hypothetical protein
LWHLVGCFQDKTPNPGSLGWQIENVFTFGCIKNKKDASTCGTKRDAARGSFYPDGTPGGIIRNHSEVYSGRKGLIPHLFYITSFFSPYQKR